MVARDKSSAARSEAIFSKQLAAFCGLFLVQAALGCTEDRGSRPVRVGAVSGLVRLSYLTCLQTTNFRHIFGNSVFLRYGPRLSRFGLD
jgi:hypothetical protein